jgi:site-specific recombinase XerD
VGFFSATFLWLLEMLRYYDKTKLRILGYNNSMMEVFTMQPVKSKSKKSSNNNPLTLNTFGLVDMNESYRIYKQLYSDSMVDLATYSNLFKFATMLREGGKINDAIDRNSIDFNGMVNTMTLQKATGTAKNYRVGLKRWYKYIESIYGLNANPLNVSNQVCIEYSSWLKNQGYKNNTIRSSIDLIKCVYSFIEKSCNVKSPFELVKKPKQEPTVIIVPTNVEINKIIKGCKNNQLLSVIAKMCRKYGYRIGFIHRLTLLGNNRIHFYSKGKWYNRKIEPVDYRLLKSLDYHTNTEKIVSSSAINNLCQSFRRICKKLYDNGSVKNLYHIHHLRHKYAVDLYGSTKDIHYTSAMLGHHSTSITEGYLRSLSFDL